MKRRLSLHYNVTTSHEQLGHHKLRPLSFHSKSVRKDSGRSFILNENQTSSNLTDNSNYSLSCLRLCGFIFLLLFLQVLIEVSVGRILI